MKLNNKGMSLIELLVSISLISIVLTLLFSILSSMRNESNGNDYAFKNQINKTEIIRQIQNDLNNNELIGIADKSANNNLILVFKFKNGEAKLNMDLEDDENNYVHYTSTDNEEYSWKMQGAKINPCGLFMQTIDNETNEYYFKINIYLYNVPYHERNNIDFNNALDDIEITYTNNLNSLDLTNNTYLTSSNKVNKQIGICAN